MERTAKSDRRARAAIRSHDELGAIATGLNKMLDQLEAFNHSLHEQIDEATRDLSLRNAQLAASHNQLLAAREALGRAERVAALGQVAANVAHQAGTPLNLISGYVQMIIDDARTDERTRSRAANSRSAGPARDSRAADAARPCPSVIGRRGCCPRRCH